MCLTETMHRIRELLIWLRNIMRNPKTMLSESKTEDSVKCEVVDGGELKSRRHLNVPSLVET